MQAHNGQQRKLYVGMHDGVCALTSHDGGSTWQKGQVTPLAHAASRLALSPNAPQRAYLVAYESGVYRTDDGGHTWKHLASYPSDYAHSVAVHPEVPDLVYVGSEPAAIFCSRDGGESWEERVAFRQVPQAKEWFFHSKTRLAHVRDLRLAPHDPDWMYAGIEVGGVVRSRDGGKSWEQLHGPDPDVHWLNFSPSRPSTAYAATAGGPYRSDDGGDTWQLIDAGLERHYTVPIAAAPDDHARVLVAVASNAGRKGAQAYISYSAGDQWSRLDDLGAEDDMVVAFAWDAYDTHRVYAGTDAGRLFASNDRGQSWQLLDISLPTVAVGALASA